MNAHDLVKVNKNIFCNYVTLLKFIVHFSFGIILSFGAFCSAGKSHKMVDYFTDMGYGNPVAPMQHPAGEYHEGVTYVAYQGLDEDPYVAAYNHLTGKWIGPYIAGVSRMGKDLSQKIDNHGKPALIIDDAGYIHLVFGGHGGTKELGENPLGNYCRGEMKHVVSKRPLDISEWEQLKNISQFGTYNQFVKMDNGDLYLFYRHGAHRSNWVYQKSIDNGRTFEAPVSVLKTKRRTDMPAHDAWYAWFLKGNDDEIIAMYNYHLCKDEPHHDGERRNGYYMVMDTKDGIWRNVKGEKLDTPVTKEQSDAMALVHDSGELWAYRGTTALDSCGHPHVTLYVGEGMGLKHGGPKSVKHFCWTGEMWTNHSDPTLPVAVGDMEITTPEKVNLLLALKDKKTNREVGWWRSDDGGKKFVQDEPLLSFEKSGISITSLIRNAHPDARVIVSKKNGPTDFCKLYLLGNNGPIQRLKSDAEQLTEADKARPKRKKN